MTLQIRPLRPGDRPAVMSLADRLVIGVAPWRDPDAVLTAVRGWVASSLAADGDCVVLVASVDDAVAGFASVSRQAHWTGEEDAYLGELVTHPDHEGRGIGRALLAAAEQWGREQGLRRLRLSTGAANTAALGFYESLGYRAEDVVLSRPLG